MHSSSVLAIALSSAVLAQTSLPDTASTATPITIIGGQYHGRPLVGSHVGAAQSYQVILPNIPSTSTTLSIMPDKFFFNMSSNQFEDTSLAANVSLPCYIINAPDMISSNSGPLECGVLSESSQRNTGILGDNGLVSLIGVQSWWVCDVNATQPYGIIPQTVVAGYTTSEPVGPGVRNCGQIHGIELGMTTTTTTSASIRTVVKSSTSPLVVPTTAVDTSTSDRVSSMAARTLADDSVLAMGSSSASAAPATYTGVAPHHGLQDAAKIGMVMAGAIAFFA